jgi:hypothetical protein
MDLPDFDELYDPDSFYIEHWARVPEPIRKIVEQHVAAHLPAKILAKLRELHTRGLPISDDDVFFHFGGGLSVRNLCGNGLVMPNWRPAAAWAAIGTIATSECSPRSPRRRSEVGRRSAGRGNSSSVSSSPSFSSTAAAAREFHAKGLVPADCKPCLPRLGAREGGCCPIDTVPKQRPRSRFQC